MITLTVYNKTTGQILKTCTCLESDILLQYNELTENFIEGSYSAIEYYIENAQPVTILPAPSKDYTFDFNTKQWVKNIVIVSVETQWNIVKFQRNQLLNQSDWTQLPDVTLATKEVWAAYRQLLRDITLQSDPFNITWPTPPGA